MHRISNDKEKTLVPDHMRQRVPTDGAIEALSEADASNNAEIDELNKVALESLRGLGDLRGLYIGRRRFYAAKRLKKLAVEHDLEAPTPAAFHPAISVWAAGMDLDEDEEALVIFDVWSQLETAEGGQLFEAYIKALAEIEAGGGPATDRALFSTDQQHKLGQVIAGMARYMAERTPIFFMSCRSLAAIIVFDGGIPFSKTTINLTLSILKRAGLLEVVEKHVCIDGKWRAPRYKVPGVQCTSDSKQVDTDSEILKTETQKTEVGSPSTWQEDAEAFLQAYPRKDCQQGELIRWWEKHRPPLDVVMKSLKADLPGLIRRPPDKVPGALTYCENRHIKNTLFDPLAENESAKESLRISLGGVKLFL